MKKNFFKKLSVVLALAMTVSAAAPTATTASAAAAPAFKSKSATLNVGQTKNYGMNNVTAYSVVKFVIGNKKVATVKKSGKTARVTGVAEGTTRLRADLKNYKTKKTSQVRINVTVKAAEPITATISSVTQTTTKKFTVGFTAALESVKLADFAMVRDNDGAVIQIKSVSLDDAKKSVTLETFNDVKDGNVYTVTYDAKSAKVTATNGTVAAVGITPETIKADTDTTVYALTLDASGVELSRDEFSKASGNVGFTLESIIGGYMVDGKLHLNAVGDTATFKVTYNSFTYNDDGTEKIALSQTFTVRAVENTTTLADFDYSIGGSAYKAGEKIIAVGDLDADIYFEIKDNAGNKVTGKEYALESSDTSKFIISGHTDSAKIVPVGRGSASIIVKDGNTVIKTLPVNILAARVAATVSLSKSSITIAGGMNVADLGEKIKATAKDQYGKDMNVLITDIELVSGGTNHDVLGSVKASILDAAVNNNGLKTDATVNIFNASALDASIDGSVTGRYNVVIKTPHDNKETKKSLSVTVKNVDLEGTVEDYKLIASDINTTVTDTSNARGEGFTLKVAKIRKNVVIGYVTENQDLDNVILRRPNGTEVSKVNDAHIFVAESKVGAAGEVAAITASANDSGAISKYLSTGKYTVSAKVGTSGNGNLVKTISTTFEVKDDQKKTTFMVNKTSVGDVDTLSNLFGNKDANNAIAVMYDGAGDTGVAFLKAKDNIKDYRRTGKFAFVGTVVVVIDVPDSGGKKIIEELTINQTFTSNNDWQ